MSLCGLWSLRLFFWWTEKSVVAAIFAHSSSLFMNKKSHNVQSLPLARTLCLLPSLFFLSSQLYFKTLSLSLSPYPHQRNTKPSIKKKKRKKHRAFWNIQFRQIKSMYIINPLVLKSLFLQTWKFSLSLFKLSRKLKFWTFLRSIWCRQIIKTLELHIQCY